jgi:hypothetical protein
MAYDKKVRFIRQFVVHTTYTYFDADGNAIEKKEEHGVRFGMLHPIVASHERSENTIDIEFPDDTPIRGVAIGIDKSFVEFVGKGGREYTPNPNGCCKGH